MSPTSLLIPSFTQMLRALSSWLDKAASQEQASGKNADALLSKRLAPDMHPLCAQVRFACFQARAAAHRLQGQPLPDQLNEVRREGTSAGDQDGSMAEAQKDIADTISYLEGLAADALDAGAERQITLDVPTGIIFDMSGDQYARDWSLPQFYFHLTIAYAILRHHGIELGKADYVAHMGAYIRPGTMPQGGG